MGTLENLVSSIENTLDSLKGDLSKINVGRAQSDIFDLIKIDYYGSMTALNHISIISAVDYNKVIIEPYEKDFLRPIEKVLRNSSLNINPQIDGNVIRVCFPQFTLERRDELIKLVKAHGEKAKVALREHRRAALKDIGTLLSKNDITSETKKAEAFVTKGVNFIESIVEAKNKNLTNMRS